ncbi:MAG: DUF2339 domain-containing protein [Acetobacteraceae bacterium]
MEEVLLGLLFLGAVIGGWVLGIVGFFKARRALEETAGLRQELARWRGAPPAGAPAPDQMSEPAPWGQSAPPPAPTDRAGPLQPPPPRPDEPPVAPEPAPGAEPQPAPASAQPDEPYHEPEQAAPAGAPQPPARDLETLLATRWGVWFGAAALLMAGVFLIRYAVEQELLGPAVRCVLAALLGGSLIGAGAWLRLRQFGGPADQAPPALAAGGVAILFGAAYGAGPLYGLMPPVFDFVLLAGVSLAGLALSLRFGPLVAAVGIAGAFVAPALIETQDPSLPGLFLYLLFVSAAALAVVRYTAWVWLGWVTTIAGAVWVLLALVTGPSVDAWAPAFFVPAVAALNLALLPPEALDHRIGRRLAWVPLAVLGAAGLLLATAQGDWATRAGVLLIAPLTVWKARSEPRLGLLPFLPAALFLLLLLGWDVRVTDWPDIAQVERLWTPVVVQSLLVTASVMAGFFAACGIFFQGRAERALPWASLTASVPVLALAVCYARVALFQPRFGWAMCAFALAAIQVGLTAVALRAARPDARQLAGAHAAGAVAALALGTAMLLADYWLSLAVALLLPALAWVEARADLPPLRRIALAVAAVVLIRLLGNWYVLDYAFGTTPILNGLLAAYGVPAAAFALAAALFRRRGDDLTVGVLEAGAVALATVLVALEVRHFSGAGALEGASDPFAEAALHVSSLAVVALATLRIATRLGRSVLAFGWRIQGSLALIGGVALLVHNPLTTGAPVGDWPLLDWLLPAYLLPSGLAVVALRDPVFRPGGVHGGLPSRVLAGYALLAGFAWITLEIRHLFHGASIGFDVAMESAELWAWSGAWLAYGAGLLIAGLRLGVRPLRLAGLALVGLVAAKVFIVDMGELQGLWRVLSFLGLGLTLIGLGTLFRRLSGRQQGS